MRLIVVVSFETMLAAYWPQMKSASRTTNLTCFCSGMTGSLKIFTGQIFSRKLKKPGQNNLGKIRGFLTMTLIFYALWGALTSRVARFIQAITESTQSTVSNLTGIPHLKCCATTALPDTGIRKHKVSEGGAKPMRLGRSPCCPVDHVALTVHN